VGAKPTSEAMFSVQVQKWHCVPPSSQFPTC